MIARENWWDERLWVRLDDSWARWVGGGTNEVNGDEGAFLA